jgi:pyruvate formate lyase activating enzyme
MHKKCTGYGNELIFDNLRRINEIKTPVFVRMIIVPDYNDDIEDIKKRIDLVSSMDNVKQIDFLKYHILGVGKYEKLGQKYELTGLGELNDSIISSVREYAEGKGKKTTVGG